MKYSVCQMGEKKREMTLFTTKTPNSMQKRHTNKNTQEKKHSIRPLKHISYLKSFRSNQFSQEM